MHGLTERLESALEAARQSGTSNQVWVETTNETSAVALLDDDCEINFAARPDYVEPANSVIVPTIQDYRALLSHELLDPNGSLSGAIRERIIRHEYEHSLASLVLEATVNAFGIYVNETPQKQIAFQPFHHVEVKTTKLGRAAIFAHPRALSDGDISQLALMGYDGAQDVHERVTANNRRYWRNGKGRVLPLPMSIATPN